METEWLVVGAGSAGCVIAGRLSEDPGRDVLVLEAGPDWRSADAPSELRSVNFWRALDADACGHLMWEGLRSRRTARQPMRPHLRGRGTGGSSAINGMIAIRAMPDDYDRWAAGGCPGWSYVDMLPYLRRMEDDLDFGDRPYHGDAGPIPVMRQDPAAWGAVDLGLADAAAALGYPWADDHNAPGSSGVSPFAINVGRDLRRVSTNDGYIEPHRSRSNLRILGQATVDRVLIERGRACGVRVRVNDEWVDVRAEHVVLSAGAIHSPAILLRSGVGPEGDVVSLPVGQGLQDHPLAVLWLVLRPAAWPGVDERQTNCVVRFSTGLEPGVDNDLALISQNQTQQAGHAVDEALAGHAGRPATGSWGIGTGAGGRERGMLCVQLSNQRSRGSLRLASSDPDAPPVIDSNLLSERIDLDRMREGVRRALELLDHRSFQGAVEHVAIDPSGRGTGELSDDAAIDEWLLETVGDAAHICGTCRMGAPDDPRSVVDPAGRVIGVEALHVADASIFPEVPRANTNLPVIAAAERMADILRDRPALAEQ